MSGALSDELLVLAEHLPFDVWVRDQHDRCVYANVTCQRNWPGLVGRTPDDTDAPADALATWRANNARARAGELVVGDVVYLIDGEPRMVRNYIAPVRRGERIVGTVGVNVDITEQRAAESNARERDELIRAVFDAVSTPMGVRQIAGDDDLVHLADNDASSKMYGRPKEAIEGVLDSSLGISRAARRAAVEVARESSRTGRAIEFEMTHEVPSVGLRHFVGRVAALGQKPGQGERFLYIADDVTERRELAAQLLRAERLSSLGTLAASIAHEIKNPASVVRLNLDLLRDEIRRSAPDASRTRWLEVIAEAEAGASAVERLVRDLGRLARPDEDTLVPTDVDEMVRSTLALGRAAVERHADLRVELGQPPLVRGNAVRLAQVVLNLVMNAAESIGQTKRHGLVVVRTSASETGARIEVEDDGPGFSEEIRARLFQPFVTGRAGGSGLGLYVSREIVQAHGGTITALPRAPGALVRVELPRASA